MGVESPSGAKQPGTCGHTRFDIVVAATLNMKRVANCGLIQFSNGDWIGV